MMFDRANPPLAASKFPAPTQGFIVTTLLIVSDIDRSRAFYQNVFDGEVLLAGSPSVVRVANTWLLIDTGGGPTDDKPNAVAAPPQSDDRYSIALNVRVPDVYACYDLWRSRGAQFLTEPKVHANETRCAIRDPDGYLIEVGQINQPQS